MQFHKKWNLILNQEQAEKDQWIDAFGHILLWDTMQHSISWLICLKAMSIYWGKIAKIVKETWYLTLNFGQKQDPFAFPGLPLKTGHSVLVLLGLLVKICSGRGRLKSILHPEIILQFVQFWRLIWADTTGPQRPNFCLISVNVDQALIAQLLRKIHF